MAWFSKAENDPSLSVPDVVEVPSPIEKVPENLSQKPTAAQSSNPNDALNELLVNTLGEDSTLVKILSSNPYFAAVSLMYISFN